VQRASKCPFCVHVKAEKEDGHMVSTESSSSVSSAYEHPVHPPQSTTTALVRVQLQLHWDTDTGVVIREECVSVFSECNWLIARTLLSLRVLLEHLPYQRDLQLKVPKLQTSPCTEKDLVPLWQCTWMISFVIRLIEETYIQKQRRFKFTGRTRGRRSKCQTTA